MLRIEKYRDAILKGEVILPASKSISNRYLIIQALNGADLQIKNLSRSNDTLLLQKALRGTGTEIDFEDAGTPMRFFLAYAAFQNLQVTITGSEGLKKRPVAPLVDALIQLGCRIEYLGEEGYVPLRVLNGIDRSKNKVTLDGTVSSQFISALLLVAPGLANGLKIEVKGDVVSKPYIDLTIDYMKHAGVNVSYDSPEFRVPAGKYRTGEREVETDWSAAAFIYAFAALSGEADIWVPRLTLKSPQGDRVIAFIYELLGVLTKEENGGLRLSKSGNRVGKIRVDFTAMPDAFPAIVATCAALRIDAAFTGIRNLAIKESNRLMAMKENLAQTGAILNIEDEQLARLTYKDDSAEHYDFKSFNDHRIAMACSIFAMKKDITIDNGEVVNKSFPGYWEVLKNLGIMK